MQRRHFTKARLALTKNDMARVIVQALYFLPTLPASDDNRVTVRVRLRKSELAYFHKRALDIINDGMSNRTWPTVGKDDENPSYREAMIASGRGRQLR